MSTPRRWLGETRCTLFERYRLVWVQVPKAACTSIAVALEEAFAGGPGTDVVDGVGVHDRLRHLEARSPSEAWTWLDTRWTGWHRFTVVRDPVRRLHSLYRERIDPGGYGTLDAWVAGNPDSPWWDDIHATLQTSIVGDLSRYDHVGRVERLGDTAAWIAERTGVAVTFGRHNVSRPARPMSPATRRLLLRRYAPDISALGYQP